MDANRRLLIKYIVGAGLATAGLPLAEALPGGSAAVPPGAQGHSLGVISLVSGSRHDAAFLAGLRDGIAERLYRPLPPHCLHCLGLGSFQRLDELLREARPALVLGLLDDASAVLAQDMVRAAGGRFLRSEHHRFAASPAADHWIRDIGHALVNTANVPPAPTGAAEAGGHAFVSFSCLI